MDWLTAETIQGVGVVMMALLLCALVWRGLLVPRPFVDRSDEQMRVLLADKDAQIASWRDSAQHWRSAFDSSQAIKTELVAQNTRLMAQGDVSVRMLEAVRDVATPAQEA